MGAQGLRLAVGAAVVAVVALVAFFAFKPKPAAGAGAGAGAAGAAGAGAWGGQPSTATESWWVASAPPFSYPCPPGVASSDGSPYYCIIPQKTAQAVCEKDPACTGYLTLPAGGWGHAEWLTGGSNPQGVLLNEPPIKNGAYQGTYYAKPAQ